MSNTTNVYYLKPEYANLANQDAQPEFMTFIRNQVFCLIICEPGRELAEPDVNQQPYVDTCARLTTEVHDKKRKYSVDHGIFVFNVPDIIRVMSKMFDMTKGKHRTVAKLLLLAHMQDLQKLSTLKKEENIADIHEHISNEYRQMRRWAKTYPKAIIPDDIWDAWMKLDK